MLGRTDERATLAERLRALRDGASGLVVIEGEAGIGKSRLMADLLEQAQARACGAYRSGRRDGAGHGVSCLAARLHPAHRAGRRRRHRGAPRARPGHVRADPGVARLAPLLDSVLPLDLPDNELTAQMSGQVRADNTRELLVRLLQAAAPGRAVARRSC